MPILARRTRRVAVGVAPNSLSIDPIKPHYWSALNCAVAVLVMFMMMRQTMRPAIMARSVLRVRFRQWTDCDAGDGRHSCCHVWIMDSVMRIVQATTRAVASVETNGSLQADYIGTPLALSIARARSASR